MSRLQVWGAAAADVWGLLVLALLVVSLLVAVGCWLAEGARWVRVRRARRRFTAEAIAEAEAALRDAAGQVS